MIDRRLEALAAAPALIVGVDFDGTLAEIVDRPDDARAVPGAVQALAALAALPNTWVAVISGRGLADLDRLVTVPHGVLRVGSHGLETSGRPEALGSAQAASLAALSAQLQALATEVPGVQLETKSWSVAVHYRHADHNQGVARVLEVAAQLAQCDGVWSKHGKEVVELFVAEASKATAVESLHGGHSGASVVYLGDDVTDEEVFAALGPNDLGVKVGDGETAATVRVPDPPAVVRWLGELATYRSRGD